MFLRRISSLRCSVEALPGPDEPERKEPGCQCRKKVGGEAVDPGHAYDNEVDGSISGADTCHGGGGHDRLATRGRSSCGVEVSRVT
jgi:hypothetical protein